jgi:DNA-binding transcriptional LysR family regulator
VDLASLRTFVAIADTGSVTAAAQRLRIAQPSLSRQLRRFEREVGLTLFDRSERRLVLSAAGHRFLPIARDLVTRAELAREAAASLREGALSTVVISTPGTTLTDIIAPFLATWRPDDPVARVWEELPSAIYSALARGADLAVGTDPPPAHLAQVAVATLPVWAYVTVADPWATRSSVTLSELVGRRLLVLGAAQHARAALDRALARERLPMDHVIEFGSPAVAQAVAAAGRGVAVLSDDPRFDLVPVRIDQASGPLVIDLYAAWSAGHHAAAPIHALAERLRTFSRERYGITAPD